MTYNLSSRVNDHFILKIHFKFDECHNLHNTLLYWEAFQHEDFAKI